MCLKSSVFISNCNDEKFLTRLQPRILTLIEQTCDFLNVLFRFNMWKIAYVKVKNESLLSHR